MTLKVKITIFTIFCGLFLMQSVASAQKNAPATAADNQEIQFPEIEGWEKGEVTVYPVPELGYSIGYRSEEGEAVTIYVYNGGYKKIPDGITDKVIKSQIDQAKSDIKKAEEMGVYEDVKELKNDTVTLGGVTGKVKALHSVFSFSLKGREVNSEIYLFGYNNNFIKIRASRPKQTVDEDITAMATLLSEIDKIFAK